MRCRSVRAAVATAVLLALAGHAHAAVDLRLLPRVGFPPRMAALEPLARVATASAALPDSPPL